jgi:hypothetical protein
VTVLAHPADPAQDITAISTSVPSGLHWYWGNVALTYMKMSHQVAFQSVNAVPFGLTGTSFFKRLLLVN